MSQSLDDPRCPECGEPIGARAIYCMHCSADLSGSRTAGDADGDRRLDSGDGGADAGAGNSSAFGTAEGGRGLLDPDGLVDDTLTVVVGIAGGLIVGVVGTVVLVFATGSGLAIPAGLVVWLGATAYLVRRRTVQAAVAQSGYAVAVVLMVVPVVAFSPAITADGGFGERVSLFFVLSLFVVIPAGVAGLVGWGASQFVSDDGGAGDG